MIRNACSSLRGARRFLPLYRHCLEHNLPLSCLGCTTISQIGRRGRCLSWWSSTTKRYSSSYSMYDEVKEIINKNNNIKTIPSQEEDDDDDSCSNSINNGSSNNNENFKKIPYKEEGDDDGDDVSCRRDLSLLLEEQQAEILPDRYRRHWPVASESKIYPYLRCCNNDVVAEAKEKNDASSEIYRLYDDNRGFSVCFLGTGSGTPSRDRQCSCTVLRAGGVSYLFDAGEGAQQQLMGSVVRVGDIEKIFVTHLHADHVLGLPGVLLMLNVAAENEKKSKRKGNQKNEETIIRIYGPEGLYNLVCGIMGSTRSVLPNIGVEIYELVQQNNNHRHCPPPLIHHPKISRRAIPRNAEDGTWTIQEIEPPTRESKPQAIARRIRIKAAEVQHVPSVQTLGYVLQESEPLPTIDAGRATKLGVKPGLKYRDLKKGFAVKSDDGTREVFPHEVLLPKQQGKARNVRARTLAVLGDACAVPPPMARLCKDVDVLVHEATLVEEDIAKARTRGHSTPSMAGRFARSVNAKVLALNHHGIRNHHLGYNSPDVIGPAEKQLKKKDDDACCVVVGVCDYMELVVPKEGFPFAAAVSTDADAAAAPSSS